uniref:E3 ubiquitin-protein ligase n=1 Tax=Otus sunia TaxID=257818 RepID=A0A8C8AQZ8_9STRI
MGGDTLAPSGPPLGAIPQALTPGGPPVPAVSFVLSRMAACGGAAKNKVTVSKRVWDFLTKESPAKLARLKEETKVSIMVDGETSDIYVLQLCVPPPGPPGGLCPARKALKALLKETEKELKKKTQRHGELVGCVTVLEPGGATLGGRGPAGSRGGGAAAPGCSREEEPDRQCPICLGEIQKMKTLEKCRHSFCEDCITRALQVKTACPMCGRFYGQLVGNQPPNGRMLVTRDAGLLLPGYEKFGTIIIQYVFPPGVQGVRWCLPAGPGGAGGVGCCSSVSSVKLGAPGHPRILAGCPQAGLVSPAPLGSSELGGCPHPALWPGHPWVPPNPAGCHWHLWVPPDLAGCPPP